MSGRVVTPAKKESTPRKTPEKASGAGGASSSSPGPSPLEPNPRSVTPPRGTTPSPVRANRPPSASASPLKTPGGTVIGGDDETVLSMAMHLVAKVEDDQKRTVDEQAYLRERVLTLERRLASLPTKEQGEMVNALTDVYKELQDVREMGVRVRSFIDPLHRAIVDQAKKTIVVAQRIKALEADAAALAARATENAAGLQTRAAEAKKIREKGEETAARVTQLKEQKEKGYLQQQAALMELTRGLQDARDELEARRQYAEDTRGALADQTARQAETAAALQQRLQRQEAHGEEVAHELSTLSQTVGERLAYLEHKEGVREAMEIDPCLRLFSGLSETVVSANWMTGPYEGLVIASDSQTAKAWQASTGASVCGSARATSRTETRLAVGYNSFAVLSEASGVMQLEVMRSRKEFCVASTGAVHAGAVTCGAFHPSTPDVVAAGFGVRAGNQRDETFQLGVYKMA
jgi:hypothetical protein